MDSPHLDSQVPLTENSVAMNNKIHDIEHLLALRAIGSTETSSEFESKTATPDQSAPPSPDGSGRPHNFQVIAPGLYRSSMPQFGNFEILEDLSLKTIITLVDKKMTLEYGNFITSSGIIQHVIPIEANKADRIPSTVEAVHKVMELMLDPRNYPMLIHCNQGKHRTGCMTACFRKICGWSDEAAIEEYVKHSAPKDRKLDKIFIQNFDPSPMKSIALERGYVGGVYKAPMGTSTASERSLYTTYSCVTYGTSDTSEHPNDYQEKIRQENDAAMESFRRWSHR